jgi:hypothetical protein
MIIRISKIKCEACRKKVSRDEMELHKKYNCPYRLMPEPEEAQVEEAV